MAQVQPKHANMVVEVSGLQEGLVLELEQEGQVVAMVLVQVAQVLAHLEALEV